MSITLGKCITRELLSVYDNDTSTFNSNTETYSLNNFPLQTKKLQSRQTQHSVVSFIKSKHFSITGLKPTNSSRYEVTKADKRQRRARDREQQPAFALAPNYQIKVIMLIRLNKLNKLGKLRFNV